MVALSSRTQSVVDDLVAAHTAAGFVVRAQPPIAEALCAYLASLAGELTEVVPAN